MLKEILNPSSCSECKLCCWFDREDQWENPVISEKIADITKKECPSGELLPYGKNSFRFRLDFNEEGLAPCPAVTDKGCSLSPEAKPFDCKIWPYRVMKKDGRLVIVLSPVCETLSARDFSETKAYGIKISGEIFREAEENPDIIKDYIEGYPIIIEK